MRSLPTPVFFVLLFIAGLFIYKDYGMGYDDGSSRYNGITNWNYIFKGDKELFGSWEKYHGPALEILLVGLEKAVKAEDTRDVFMTHHLGCFIFFYLSAIVFFFISKTLFNDDRWALLATAMLVLSPRIFADAFYNSKDLGFLCAMIFAFATLLKLIRTPTFLWLLLHCLALGFAIDIRILGIVMAPVTIVLLAAEFIKRRERLKWLLLIIYPFALYGAIIIFWPVMWRAPGFHFERALIEMKTFPWTNKMFYFGQYVPSGALPWHYLPVWILITTPVLISLLWAKGLIDVALKFVWRPKVFFQQHLIWAAVAVLCIGPVLMVIVLHSVVYDAWRHVFFIYPFFVLLAVYGFKNLSKHAAIFTHKWLTPFTLMFIAAMAALNIYMHPYQNTYFNLPAIAFLKPDENFEMDYWGLSYKQALEYLSKTESRTPIKVSVTNNGHWNAEMLKPEERSRFEFGGQFHEVHYFVSNHRYNLHDAPPDAVVVHNISRFRQTICTVYKLR